MENNIRLLVMPAHASHLLQPLDLAVFGPLKALLSSKLNRVTRLGVYRLRKREWLCAYAAVRPIAFRASNIASAFRCAGLIPHAPSMVLRRLPPEPKQPKTASARRQQRLPRRARHQLRRQASPTGPSRRKANSIVRKMLLSEKPLRRSAKIYLQKVVDSAEMLQAQLTIA
jgi:hypothetical protein